MASSATVQAPVPPVEKTFRSYTPEQGSNYAENRMGYHDSLYKVIVGHHTSTGGKMGTLLDVGCGPGTVARELGPQFARAIGLDPAPGMIAAARSIGGFSATHEPIQFHVSTAEELGANLSPAVADASVDIVTAATAAHWFNMPGFWAAAARVLKPGGTVAIWTGSAMYIHPSTPNASRLQAVLKEFRTTHLEPYMAQGNFLGETNYEALPLPWTLEKPMTEFDESSFFRKTWNRRGSLAPGEEFFLGQKTLDMDAIENFFGTVSPVTRWREAHPEDVGTERDVARLARRRIEALLHEAGVKKGKEIVTTGISGVLLMVKKRS
ncbi:Trans-aconitate 3-methyltransferase [Colletotrichum chlorophyti]|uniref:Trans-aconitate 3-methyltransferase n=1 Tax=Colletotrichum chlorophyti TaxID=708187 RepID=A0A1Q8RBI7_9PEZI|nr:Trans-aconitate 3-methyltransferase [Colletotrichum chlorophyti]